MHMLHKQILLTQPLCQMGMQTKHFCKHLPKTTTCSSSFTYYCQICARNKPASKCHICQLVHVYMWDNYQYIYLIWTQCHQQCHHNMYTFHIIDICPWTNTVTTLSLKKYCNSYLPCSCCIYANKNNALKCHIYASHANYFMCISETTMSVYMLHINSLQSTMWPGTLVYIYFTLLAYAPKHICLPHCTYMYHCTTTIVYIHTPN